MSAPFIVWSALVPLLIVLGGGVVGLLLESFVSRRLRRQVQLIFTLLVLAGAIAALAWRIIEARAGHAAGNVISSADSVTGATAFVEDMPALLFQLVILVCSFFAVLVIADRTAARDGSLVAAAAAVPFSAEERETTKAGYSLTEAYPLVLFSVGGMMSFASANDTLTLFVALELLSLPLYVLTAVARRRRALSQEAAIKYFLLGSFSSAFFLLGAAFLYGYSGSTAFAVLSYAPIANITQGQDALLILGFVLVMVGLLFKVGAAPFHSWTPDVYQGAPTPITGFMAAGTKIAAYAALIRITFAVGHNIKADIQPFMWVVIIVTMLVGTVMGIVQTDVKRMLAYSSIAHTGFMLIAVISFQVSSIPALIVYLAGYGLASVGAFAVVTLVRKRGENGEILGEATDLNSWKGLGKQYPALAISMLIFLLSFAGIPLTAGFIGKFMVFTAGIQDGMTWLVVLAIISSAATAFFYFRLVKYMFFEEPDTENTVIVKSEGFTFVAIAFTAFVTILLGVLPKAIITLLEGVAEFAL
ncbi:MAG: NADH-quinone oxidoreductase subunit NuoN [Actinomycetaceae bacterium]|nr:NADH-quinone oxidoreductase subunit NuoN [Actinomycetaceae bacterium]